MVGFRNAQLLVTTTIFYSKINFFGFDKSIIIIGAELVTFAKANITHARLFQIAYNAEKYTYTGHTGAQREK